MPKAYMVFSYQSPPDAQKLAAYGKLAIPRLSLSGLVVSPTPATRPGASPPTSPNCLSCCGERSEAGLERNRGANRGLN